MCVLRWGLSPSRYAHISQKPHSSRRHSYPQRTMKAHLPRLNELRKVLSSAGNKPHPGIRPDASRPTESDPPDDWRPNSQAVLDERMLTEENDESERDGAQEVDSGVTIGPPESPPDVANRKILMSLICDLETRVRKLEEQVADQNQENHRLHRRVSSTYESVPTSHTKSRRSARYKEMESE
ncbi:uncharacterized protein AKAW2_50464A [Aspergillus luchuensis]|uniref:Uncharacterized protein n=1 Tax=Aspergillus kawachii TaxID=1069201 RepID=A0A7R7WBX1_ASPKA|nr:uncharacterized protein AKAW2_50464A [Aspergillus luchuensis]BCS00123.1 hypothetical protein AKAW2_50464A [Aspergillus luchuensis]